MTLASEASQAEAAHQAAPRSSNGKPDAATRGRPIEARMFRLLLEQVQIEGQAKRNGGCSAMEVDQEVVEGGRSSGSKLFRNLFGSPNFN